MTPRLFGHGHFRLYLLKLLEDLPRHGYDLIRALEEELLGTYSPSAGSVYPRLAALEEEGLVQSYDEDGRKMYRITDAGREELRARADELREVGKTLLSAREIAVDIRGDVRSAVRELRRELRQAADEVRREVRTELKGVRHEVHREARGLARELRLDLDAFVSDIMSAVRAARLDQDGLREARSILRDARAALVRALLGDGAKDEREDTDA